jgi:hypothetical protein
VRFSYRGIGDKGIKFQHRGFVWVIMIVGDLVFQHNWDICGDDLTGMVLRVLNGDKTYAGINTIRSLF